MKHYIAFYILILCFLQPLLQLPHLFLHRFTPNLICCQQLLTIVFHFTHINFFRWTDHIKRAIRFLFPNIFQSIIVYLMAMLHCFDQLRIFAKSHPDQRHQLVSGLHIIKRLCQDDKLDTVKERLKVYYDQTHVLKSFYDIQNKRVVIDGSQPLDKITEDITEVLEV